MSPHSSVIDDGEGPLPRPALPARPATRRHERALLVGEVSLPPGRGGPHPGQISSSPSAAHAPHMTPTVTRDSSRPRIRPLHGRPRLAGTALVVCAALLAAACSEKGGGQRPPIAISGPDTGVPETLSTAATPSAVTSHPRLWLTAADLPRLRSWATDSNLLWTSGLRATLGRVRATVDGGKLDDDGSPGWVADPVESYAEVLAFGSLIEPDAADRARDARRARRLLMGGIDAAAAVPADGKPYRSSSFSIDDRSRWWGEGWALTVDWIYPSLSTADKQRIRTVFLRWSEEDIRGGQTTNDHPEPIGIHNDPKLIADPVAVRWATNNYYNAHARNVALMALALDKSDDPDGRLRAHLEDATGAFLYVSDALLRSGLAGGAPGEGFEYGPQSLGYLAELLLALHTAGVDNAVVGGRQVTFAGNPFWDQVGPWLLSSLSPGPVAGPDGQSQWLPDTYGDTQTYHNPDWIELFGPLGIYDATVGNNPARVAMSRWIERETPDGGAATLADRAGNPNVTRDSILYFMLFDPSAPLPADPRPGLPTTHVAAGMGRLSARTAWSPDSSWFTFGVGWNQVDHQAGDGLSIALYRKGQWLTKERSGYDVSTSDHKNTLAIENTAPEHNDPSDYRHIEWTRGSQYTYVVNGPGRLVAASASGTYVYAAGDATDLYNSSSEGSNDVIQATRSVVWLKPDVAVVYDRATTGNSGRFKRFFLQLPAMPRIDGRHATVTTASGQQLSISTLLPADATLRGEQVSLNQDRQVADEGQVAGGEPMTHRLRVEAPGGPADARFLHVLQGLDDGASPTPTSLVESLGGTPFAGARVGETEVLSPSVPIAPRTSASTSRRPSLRLS
jgi:hypothetical protein